MKIAKKHNRNFQRQSAFTISKKGSGNSTQNIRSHKESREFTEILNIKKNENRLTELSKIIDHIEIAGKLLESNPTLLNFSSYKNKVQSFLQDVVPHTFTISRSILLSKSSGNSGGKLQKKELHVINTLNDELASLLQLIKNREKNHIAITSSIMGIKGLLVDVLR